MAQGVKRADAKTGVGSRRIFAPHFKLQVLDSYRNDADCKGNQRATARKYGIHRRQIQKWLQAESNLRNSVKGGENRQRDDDKCAAPARLVPPEAPMDLSVKRSNDDGDVWDLSTKKHRREREESSSSSSTSSSSPLLSPPLPSPSKPPIKLFKPYLDDVMNEQGSNCSDDASPKFTELTPPPPCCANTLLHYYGGNNNNSPEYAYPPQDLQTSYFYVYPRQQCSPSPSYSVDFKLSAIEYTYCRDNIHKRQIHRWFQQEDETIPMHVVR